MKACGDRLYPNLGRSCRRGALWTLALLMILWPVAATTSRAEESSEVACQKSPLAVTGTFAPDGRQYAPHRKVDIKHVLIDVTPDFKKRTVAGKTTHRFAPIGLPLSELKLDALDLTISSVESSAKMAGYQVTGEEIIITFEKPIEVGTETTVTIAHSAEPAAGLYFRTPEMGYKQGDAHIFTQGEQNDARFWFPCFDSPNEKFTSEIICHVPEGMTVFSNGRKVSEEKDASGLVAVRWLQDLPHPAYLIALCAGYFKGLEEKQGDVPLGFFTPPSYIDKAANSFAHTGDMMAFFEKEIGVKYPWAKYYQVIVDDFVAGGMENTSLTIETTRTLFDKEIENTRDSEGLVAHELAHQWFGDLVTCKDWSHTWLNEGFASYYDILFAGSLHGQDQFNYRLLGNADVVLADKSPGIPIVNRKFDDSMTQFSFRSYMMGSWVLHMLRSQLGPDLYRECIKTYLERHKFQNVVTEDLRAAIEEVSGRSFDRFFDQWLYHAKFPQLEVKYNWEAGSKLAKVSLRQTQEINDTVLLFDFPLRLRFKGKGWTSDQDVYVNAKEQDFFVPLAEAPEIVRVDPDYALLAKVAFDKPAAMLYAQLADSGDMMGRIFAARELAAKDDQQTVGKLKTALNGDPFFGVRREAAKALEKIHTPAAFDALASSTAQDDARARLAVMDALAGFFSDEALAALKKSIENEKNPAVAAAAIRGLGRYHQEASARELLVKELSAQSYDQERTGAAFDAIKSFDDPALIDPVRETLKRREKELPTRTFIAGLGTLGYIARTEERRGPVRDFLIGYLSSPRTFVRAGALSALGALGDPSAISTIETYAPPEARAGSRGDAFVRQAAEGALKSLREAKKVPVELGDLRSEVNTLKKDNAQLKKELDEVKKRLDASPAAKSGSKPPEKRRGFLGFIGR